MNALNKDDLKDPLFRMAAEGWQWREDDRQPEIAKDGIQARNGGISCLGTREMAVGQDFYRFASVKYASDPVSFLDSPWWLEEKDYYKIRQFSRNVGPEAKEKPMTVAVRTLCAVPTDWNDCDLIIRASLQKPLAAYWGPGRSAQRKDKDGAVIESYTTDRNHPLALYRVNQLYFPGFRLPMKTGWQNPYRGALRIEELIPV